MRMDFEGVLPKTCQSCYGTGTIKYTMPDGDYSLEACHCQKEETNG